MASTPNRPGVAARSVDDAQPPVPRWVKAFAIVLATLVLLIVAMLVLGGDQHGPGQHMSAAGATAAAPAGVDR